ncbi:hypothetical protein ACOMHN_037993 [Nucella lapillus]
MCMDMKLTRIPTARKLIETQVPLPEGPFLPFLCPLPPASVSTLRLPGDSSQAWAALHGGTSEVGTHRGGDFL